MSWLNQLVDWLCGPFQYLWTNYTTCIKITQLMHKNRWYKALRVKAFFPESLLCIMNKHTVFLLGRTELNFQLCTCICNTDYNIFTDISVIYNKTIKCTRLVLLEYTQPAYENNANISRLWKYTIEIVCFPFLFDSQECIYNTLCKNIIYFSVVSITIVYSCLALLNLSRISHHFRNAT